MFSEKDGLNPRENSPVDAEDRSSETHGGVKILLRFDSMLVSLIICCLLAGVPSDVVKNMPGYHINCQQLMPSYRELPSKTPPPGPSDYSQDQWKKRTPPRPNYSNAKVSFI